MDRFNRLFQKSTENTTCQLYNKMSRLVRLYASNVLKADVIIASTDNFSTLNLTRESHLDDENLNIGDDTWTFVAELESECDTKPFYTAVRMFCVATI